MAFLTNWIFWAILVAIIVVLAIIGYLAEGTKLGRKQAEKQTTVTPNPSAVNETSTEAAAPAPSAWTGEIKKEDTRHETVHQASSIDDWTKMPGVNEPETQNPATPEPEEKLFTQAEIHTTKPSAEMVNPNPTPTAKIEIEQPVSSATNTVPSEAPAPIEDLSTVSAKEPTAAEVQTPTPEIKASEPVTSPAPKAPIEAPKTGETSDVFNTPSPEPTTLASEPKATIETPKTIETPDVFSAPAPTVETPAPAEVPASVPEPEINQPANDDVWK